MSTVKKLKRKKVPVRVMQTDGSYREYDENDSKKELLDPEVLYQGLDNSKHKFRLVLNKNCQLKWERSTAVDSMDEPVWLPTRKLEIPEELDINDWSIIFEIAKVVVTKSQEEHIISKLKDDVGFSTNSMFDDDEF